jgi:hypothetical protein
MKKGKILATRPTPFTMRRRPNEAVWKVGSIPQRNLQDHSREELDELWNFGIAWERLVGAEKKEKGIVGYQTIPFRRLLCL